MREGCAIHAYVLMTNHVHLLMTPVDTGRVARVMQALGRRYKTQTGVRVHFRARRRADLRQTRTRSRGTLVFRIPAHPDPCPASHASIFPAFRSMSSSAAMIGNPVSSRQTTTSDTAANCGRFRYARAAPSMATC